MKHQEMEQYRSMFREALTSTRVHDALATIITRQHEVKQAHLDETYQRLRMEVKIPEDAAVIDRLYDQIKKATKIRPLNHVVDEGAFIFKVRAYISLTAEELIRIRSALKLVSYRESAIHALTSKLYLALSGDCPSEIFAYNKTSLSDQLDVFFEVTSHEGSFGGLWRDLATFLSDQVYTMNNKRPIDMSKVPFQEEMDDAYASLWEATRHLAKEEMLSIPALGMRKYRLELATLSAGNLVIPADYDGFGQNPTGRNGSYRCRDCPTKMVGAVSISAIRDSINNLVRVTAATLALKMPDTILDLQQEMAPCMSRSMNRDLVDEKTAHCNAAADYHARQIGLYMRDARELRINDKFMAPPFAQKSDAKILKNWAYSDSLDHEVPNKVAKRRAPSETTTDSDEYSSMQPK